MLRSRFAKALLTCLLTCLAPSLLMAGCSTQQGIIERPDWAKEPVSWDYTGVTISTFGTPPYSQANVQDASRMAEESAANNLRRLLARELAKAYLKASKASVSEDDAARQLENAVGNLLEKQHYYDAQRQVYFVQIFVPASRLEEMINQTFSTHLKLQKDGTLAPA
ncbi:MAG: hypothetical protein ACAI44_06240 [Candidatus Sericytochromatia bacterium]